jgi:FkbM family methyltransferase
MIYYTGDEFVGRSLDLYGEYSEFEIELFRQVIAPGATVIDAGAHFGVFTVYFAQAVGPAGRVYVFEPQRALYHIVCGNLALNGLTNVVAQNAALGAAPGTVRVPVVNYAGGGNFGAVELGSGGEEVALSTIDALGLDQCRLIKIDVEGMEQQVLEGARATLTRCRPFLYVENDRPAKSASLIRWLLEHDYRLYWHLPKMFNPDNHFGNATNVFPRLISINMFCVPRAMDVPMTGFVEITSPDAEWRDADATYHRGWVKL